MVNLKEIKEDVRRYYQEHEKEIADKGKGTLFEFSMSREWEELMLETMLVCHSIADHMGRTIVNEVNLSYYLDDSSWFMGPSWSNPNVINLIFHVQLHPGDAAKLSLDVSKLAAEAGKEVFVTLITYGFIEHENSNIRIIKQDDKAQELTNHVLRRIEWRAEDLKFPPMFIPGINTGAENELVGREPITIDWRDEDWN